MADVLYVTAADMRAAHGKQLDQRKETLRQVEERVKSACDRLRAAAGADSELHALCILANALEAQTQATILAIRDRLDDQRWRLAR